MIKAIVNGKDEFVVEGNTLNGSVVQMDLIALRDNAFHILHNNKSYVATLTSFSEEDKTMMVNVNGNNYEITIRDKNDLLLQKLGLGQKSSSAVRILKAPMPGLIIQVSAEEGQQVNKGDTLMILEAMKMENAIKSPRDGVVKKVNVALRHPVEKNQPLIEFE